MNVLKLTYLRNMAQNFTFEAVPSRMPNLSSNLVNFALLKRSFCVDVKDMVAKAEISLNFPKYVSF